MEVGGREAMSKALISQRSREKEQAEKVRGESRGESALAVDCGHPSCCLTEKGSMLEPEWRQAVFLLLRVRMPFGWVGNFVCSVCACLCVYEIVRLKCVH